MSLFLYFVDRKVFKISLMNCAFPIQILPAYAWLFYSNPSQTVVGTDYYKGVEAFSPVKTCITLCTLYEMSSWLPVSVCEDCLIIHN